MWRQSSSLPAYLDPRGVILDALQAFLPPDPTPVDEFACTNRYLSNPGGYTGRFSFDPTPYLREPTRLLGGADHDAVVVVGPGQSAKTTVAENWLCHAVAEDPANLLWYMQSEEARDAYVKAIVNPMVEQHRFLADRLGGLPIDNSLRFKNFGRMFVEFLAANRSSFINKKAPKIVLDEVDAYDPALGDVKSLSDIRRQTFHRSMLLAISHCDLATGLNPATDWGAGIMAMYADSDRRIWWWPCPHCGAWSSPVPTASAYMELRFDLEGDLERVAESAHLLCPHNGCAIADSDRRAMNARGFWAGLGQRVAADGSLSGDLVPKSTAGFWIVGAMSPFVRGGLGGLARARVKAERELAITGDLRSLKEVIVKSWGFPFDERALGLSDEIDPAALRARAGGYSLGTVPAGVRYLLAFVDVQKLRFVVQVEGCGPDGVSWLVDRFDVSRSNRRDANGERELVNPSLYLDDWRLLRDQVVLRRWPLADGSGTMQLQLCAVDSGGEEGVTELAYEFHRWLRAEGLDRRCLLTKGDGNPRAPRARQTFPDSGRRDRSAGARGEVPVWLLNANVLKDGVARVLRGRNPSRDYLHFPNAEALPEGFFEEYAAEKRVRGVWERQKPRNEAFDASYAIRALRLLVGGERIDWANPPAWAAAWEHNELVSREAAAPAAPAAAHPSLSIAERLARLNR